METELATKTPEERRAILLAAIGDRVRRGYRVVSQTDTSAQVMKPKTFSVVFALLWFLVGGIGLLIYVLYYVGKKDRQHYIEVDEYGRLTQIPPR